MLYILNGQLSLKKKIFKNVHKSLNAAIKRNELAIDVDGLDETEGTDGLDGGNWIKRFSISYSYILLYDICLGSSLAAEIWHDFGSPAPKLHVSRGAF